MDKLRPYHENGIVLDLGTGDGAYVFKQALTNPNKFFIGIDSNAENMCDISRKAMRRPEKGGLSNLLFVHAAIENLPEELYGIASEISIILPWGSLLKSVATPDLLALNALAKLCRTGTKLKIIFGYELANEEKLINNLRLPSISPEYLNAIVIPNYQSVGFEMTWRFVNRDELKRLPTTWAKKLAYGKERKIIEINGVYQSR